MGSKAPLAFFVSLQKTVIFPRSRLSFLSGAVFWPCVVVVIAWSLFRNRWVTIWFHLRTCCYLLFDRLITCYIVSETEAGAHVSEMTR